MVINQKLKGKGICDMSKCATLASELEEVKKSSNNKFHNSKYETDGERTVTYSETWVPGMGTYHECHSRPANNIEKEFYEQKKHSK